MGKKKILWLCTYGDAAKWSHVDRWAPLHRVPYGLWIPDLLRGFAGDESYELHIVSFTVFQKRSIVHWERDGIYYHSYQKGLPFVGATLPWIDYFFNHLFNKLRIWRIVRKVKPDLIHLFGAENPEYASAVPRLSKKYPVMQTIQGFKTRELTKTDAIGFVGREMLRRRCKTEIEVSNIGDVFICEPDSAKYLSTIRKTPFKSLTAYFPINEELVRVVRAENLEKEYDFIFLARMTKAKGIEDFVRIAKSVLEKHPEMQCAAAGLCMDKATFEGLCSRFGVLGKIKYLGRLATQKDVYETLSKAKVYLIPTYNDAFPTTIRESMSLGTAVVAYKTGGIPYVNEPNQPEYAALVGQGDWQGMAVRTLQLLEDDQGRKIMIDRAFARAREKFSLEASVKIFKQAYKDLLGG